MNKVQIDLTGAKILAVDDVPANLDVLSQALEAGGYNVLVATSGETALDLVSRIEPDLILLDVMMPGMDGLQVAREVRSRPQHDDVRIILLTAKGQDRDIEAGLAAGADDYMTKPFSPSRLLARTRDVLESRRKG